MDDVVKAFDLWIELTGVDPNAKQWSTRNWDVYQANNALKHSLELDTTCTLTLLLLDYFTEQYLHSRVFSVQSILDDYNALTSYLALSKELIAILKSEHMADVRADYLETIESALDFYGIERTPELTKLLDNFHALAFLRRDALNSLNTLKLNQFAQGSPSGNRPVIYNEIMHFWNINSLVIALSNMSHDGIVLCFIEDPLLTSSFFAFGIRNGGTITVLSDRAEYVDPDQKYRLNARSRGVARDLYNRTMEHHFPYSVIHIEVDETQRAYVRKQKADGLIPYKTEFLPIKRIKDLEPNEIIWTSMMFSLIEEKFFKNDYKAKQLSYTGEMLVNTEKLTQSTQNALVSQTYQPLHLSLLTSEDVTTEKVMDDFEYKPTAQHAYLEKLYEDKIDDRFLNVVGVKNNGETLQMIDSPEENLADQLPIPAKSITTLEPTYFGTEEQINRDHRFVARYNKTRMLQQAIDEDFEKRKDEITTWYRQRIEQNFPFLLEAIANNKLIFSHLIPSKEEEEKHRVSLFSNRSANRAIIRRGNSQHHRNDGNILLLDYSKDAYIGVYKTNFQYHQGVDRYKGEHKCFIRGTTSSIAASFHPVNAECLRILTGSESIEDLPDVLREWRFEAKDTSANHLLNRVDPMDWLFENPWQDKMDFRIVIHLSKLGYGDIRKEFGLSNNRFWDKKPEKDEGLDHASTTISW